MFAIRRRAQQVPLESAVGSDRSSKGSVKYLVSGCTHRLPPLHSPVDRNACVRLGAGTALALPSFTGRLMTIFGRVIHACGSLDEHVFDAGQLGGSTFAAGKLRN